MYAVKVSIENRCAFMRELYLMTEQGKKTVTVNMKELVRVHNLPTRLPKVAENFGIFHCESLGKNGTAVTWKVGEPNLKLCERLYYKEREIKKASRKPPATNQADQAWEKRYLVNKIKALEKENEMLKKGITHKKVVHFQSPITIQLRKPFFVTKEKVTNKK